MIPLLALALPQASVVLTPPEQQLVHWTRSPVLCGSGDAPLKAEAATVSVEPGQTLTWAWNDRPRSMTLEFRIDATGRPLSIRREGDGYVAAAQDVIPAFVATRFAPGVERPRCTVTFTASSAPLSAAPLDDVMAYSVFPSSAPTEAVWRRIRPAGSDCYDPAPDVLLRAFPNFAALPDLPGALAWSITGYDIDAAGQPIHVRTVIGSATPELDTASRDAVARSRFVAGARRGCLWPYFKAPATLAAPTPPEEEALRPAGATCPGHHDWARKPQLAYPQPYRRRNIEGWAMVAYDVAPWGQTGNVRVLAAEPAAEFGDAAAAMIRAATLPPSTAGYVGCIDRVRYVIQKPGMPTPPAEDAPPIVVD